MAEWFSEEDFLNLVKDKSKSILTGEQELKSHIKVHDCGHDEGKPCINVVEVL